MAAEYKLIYPPEPKACNYLYDTELMALMGGRPFIVGKARFPVYGFLPTLISRSKLIEILVEDDVDQFTSSEPFHLLPDEKGFDGLELPFSFKIVWNYLNGIYPETYMDEDQRMWPKDGLTIEEKYQTVYYINWFGIDVKAPFVDHYVTLFTYDLVDALHEAKKQEEKAVMKLPPEYGQRLVELAFLLRPIIGQVEHQPFRLYERLAEVLPVDKQRDMVFGTPKLPKEYQLLPADEKKGYQGLDIQSQMSESSKPLQIYFFALWEEDLHVYKEHGPFEVKNILEVTPEELTGVTPPERKAVSADAFGIPLPLPSLPSPVQVLPDSPVGFPSDVVQWYHNKAWADQFMIITVKTDKGDIRLYQAPNLRYWLAPAFSVNGANGFGRRRGVVHLFVERKGVPSNEQLAGV